MNMTEKEIKTIDKRSRKDIIYLMKNAKKGTMKLSENMDQVTVVLQLNEKCQKYVQKQIDEERKRQLQKMANVVYAFSRW